MQRKYEFDFNIFCLESEYDYLDENYIYTDGVYDDYYENYDNYYEGSNQTLMSNII